MSLCDPTEEYSHHTWGAEHHVRLVATKGEQSCTQHCRVFNTITPSPQITKLIEAEDQSHLQPILREAKFNSTIIPADFHSNAGQCWSLPVKPHASASRNVLQDIRKNKPVSSKGNSRSLVNLVTLQIVKDNLERNCRLRECLILLCIVAVLHSLPLKRLWHCLSFI